MLLSGSLPAIEGEAWKAQRRITGKVFHFDYLRNLIPSIQRLTNETFAQWSAEGPGKELAALDTLQQLVGSIVGVTFFGSDREKHQIEGKPIEMYFSELLTDSVAAAITPLAILFGIKALKYGLTPFYRKLNRNNKIYRAFVSNIIQERRAQFDANKSQGEPKEKDLLDILFESQDSQTQFTDDELIDMFAAFYAGGTDTSSHLLQSLFYLLEQNPECKQKLIEEVSSVIKDPSEAITQEQLNRLEFTTAVIKESLRVVPPIPHLVQREAIVDHYLGDFFIPKGMYVGVDYIALHYHPKIFENPEKFNPYRWIKGHQDYNEDANRDPFKFLPFAAGPRNCIGQPLAMLEMKIILALFASQFDWKIKEGYKWKLIFKFGYEPEEQVPLILYPKNIKA